MQAVFKDLCTIPELKALSQRFQVAKMLTKDHVYSDIVNENRCFNGNYKPCEPLAFL